jgi:transcriptional regulator with XRE-family HTH domain
MSISSEQLTRRRTAVKATQAELAERAGVDPGNLSKMESGARRVSEDVVEALECIEEERRRQHDAARRVVDRLMGSPMQINERIRRRATKRIEQLRASSDRCSDAS